MKKKIIMGAAACMIAALSVVGLNANKTNSSNVTMSDLVMTSDANADWGGSTWIADGHRVFGYGFCCVFHTCKREDLVQECLVAFLQLLVAVQQVVVTGCPNFCIFRMDGTDCDPYAN